MRPECLKRLIGLQIAIVVALLTAVLVTFLITDFQKNNKRDDVVSDPKSTSMSSPYHNNWNVGNNSIETDYSSISISGSKGIDHADLYNINNTLNITQGQHQEGEQEDGISAVNDADIIESIDQQQLGRTEEETEENNDYDVISGIIVENGDEIDEDDTIVLEVETELTANDNVVVSNDSLSKEEFLPSSYSRGMMLPDKATEKASDIRLNKQPIPEYFREGKRPGRSSTAITPSSSSSPSSQLLPSPSNRTEISADDPDDSISDVPSDGPSLNPSSVPTRSPSSMPSDFQSLSLVSDKPSDGTTPTGAPSNAVPKLINPNAVPISSVKFVNKQISNVPSDGPSLNPSTTPTSVPINDAPRISDPNGIRVSSINNINKQTNEGRSDTSGTFTCPNNSPIGKGCNGFEENLNCGYNYFYTGCTFDVLACVPSVTCKCLPGGEWSCDGIFEQPCWGMGSDPGIVEGECDPNEYLPASAQQGQISPTPTNLPTIGVSTFAPTVTTGPTSFAPSISLSPTSTFIPTQTHVPTSFVPTQTALCPITHKPDAVCSASINNRDCHYDYVYMGCSWIFLTCGPTVECSCESPYGEDDGIWSCVEKKYGNCGLRRPADLPPLGESCDPDDELSSTTPTSLPPPPPTASESASPSVSESASPSDSPTTSPTDSPTTLPSQSPTTSPSGPPSDTSLRPSTSLETISATDPLSTECPLSLQFGRCAEFQENLQCSYNHIYHGCTWDALTCLPSVICDCQQGIWLCTGDFMKTCEIDQGISPDEGLPWREECDPNEVVSSEIIVSISPSITPPTDLPTVVPTPRNYDDHLIKECPDTFQLGSCGNEYVDDLKCDYNYIHIGCTWEDLKCSPSVSCRCDHWHGYWECKSTFANCYAEYPLSVPDDLPWGETCDPEQALTLPTR